MHKSLTRTPLIAPSILSADFANLADALASVDQATDRIHVDVMDGHFVPNLTIGAPVVKSLRPNTEAFLDCHLMCTKPEILIDDFVKAGADAITIHVEIGKTKEYIKQIKDLGVYVGLSLNPDTPFESIKEFMKDVDIILFMSVFPGFGGQSFIPEVLDKVREADRYRPRPSLQARRPRHRTRRPPLFRARLCESTLHGHDRCRTGESQRCRSDTFSRRRARGPSSSAAPSRCPELLRRAGREIAQIARGPSGTRRRVASDRGDPFA